MSFFFNQRRFKLKNESRWKSLRQIQLTSADLRINETASGLRRRKIRRRAQRRSLTETRPPPNDDELRWKSRQRNTHSDESDISDDYQSDSYTRRFLTSPVTTGHYVPNEFHHSDPVALAQVSLIQSSIAQNYQAFH